VVENRNKIKKAEQNSGRSTRFDAME